MTETSTRDQILACARSLIERGGYDGFSYADIAAAVGIRKASIHHHFPTKADLVRSLVQGYVQAARARAQDFAAAGLPARVQLQGFADYWTQCIAQDSPPFCLCAMLAHALPLLPAEVATEVRAYFALLQDWLTRALTEGQARGELRLSASPDVEAEEVMATFHGAMLSARVGGPEVFARIAAALMARLTGSGDHQR